MIKQENSLLLSAGISAVAEEIAGRKRFWISGEEQWLPAYQLDALEINNFRRLLPMSFVEITGQKKIYYDIDGFIQLSGALTTNVLYRPQNARTATEVLLRTLAETALCVLEIEDQLLINNTFFFSAESIFMNTCTGEIRLAYIPCQDKKYDNQIMLLDLIKSMQDLCSDDQWQDYARDLLEEIPYSNKGFSELIKYFNMKARDACLRGWPGEGMERENVQKDTDTDPVILPKKSRYFPFDSGKK